MNTHALESKTSAVKLLSQIAENMGTAFAPYVEATFPIMKELMSYSYSKAIKKAATKSMQYMIIAVGAPNNLQLFNMIFNDTVARLPKLVDSQNTPDMKIALKGLYHCMKAINTNNDASARNFMTQEQMNTLGPLLKQVLDLVNEIRTESLKGINQMKKEMDEEDLDAVKEQLAKMCKPATYVMEICGQLSMTFKADVEPMIKANVAPYFAKLLNNFKNNDDDETIDSICFFCDHFNYCQHTDGAMMAEVATKFGQIYESNDNPDVRQSVVYGMGIFSQFMPEAQFANFRQSFMTLFKGMISSANAFSDE